MNHHSHSALVKIASVEDPVGAALTLATCAKIGHPTPQRRAHDPGPARILAKPAVGAARVRRNAAFAWPMSCGRLAGASFSARTVVTLDDKRHHGIAPSGLADRPPAADLASLALSFPTRSLPARATNRSTLSRGARGRPRRAEIFLGTCRRAAHKGALSAATGPAIALMLILQQSISRGIRGMARPRARRSVLSGRSPDVFSLRDSSHPLRTRLARWPSSEPLRPAQIVRSSCLMERYPARGANRRASPTGNTRAWPRTRRRGSAA